MPLQMADRPGSSKLVTGPHNAAVSWDLVSQLSYLNASL